jgi:hypothetical protein
MKGVRLRDLPPAKRKLIQAQTRKSADEQRAAFMSYCTAAGLPSPQPEHRFALPARQWRFDWAFPEQRVALEVEGGVWTEGRHTRGSGFVADMDKYNEAACRGWRIVRVVPGELYEGRTLDLLRRALGYEASS